MLISNITINSVANFISDCASGAIDLNIEQKFHMSHPRFQALSRMSGSILDLGAGDGGMGQLIAWPQKQIGKSLVGCDLEEISTLPKGYSDWVSGGWENIPPELKFGGVLAIHVIEHLDCWTHMLRDALERVHNGGYVYVEWPSPETISWPAACDVWTALLEMNPGFTTQLLSTFNFFDDDSHTDNPPSMEDVLNEMSSLEIIEHGRLLIPDYATNLVSKGLTDQSKPNVTMGIWAQFGFAQYILAKK
jgi:hypothetical protein